MSENAETDLAFVSTSELWIELRKRFNSCVFVYEMPGDNSGELATGYWRWASYPACLGLLEYGVIRAKKEIEAMPLGGRDDAE